MLDIPSRYPSYQFPLKSIGLKYKPTHGYVEAELIQLTRWRAYWNIDRVWWKFRGPFHVPCEPQEDAHWKWVTHVRRLRKNPETKCAAARTPDGRYQGAIIYRRDGVSLLESNTNAVYAEFVATAPSNRPRYAADQLYSGVGKGLVYLAILESYLWGFGGRVSLYSLPSSVWFYTKLKFFRTGDVFDDMIHFEMVPEAAVDLLKNNGLI
jgi:hypothetical protein